MPSAIEHPVETLVEKQPENPVVSSSEPLAIPKEANKVLKDVFGFDQFREGQVDVVSRLLDGRSVLSIFPTGGGKSLCYQLPAMLLDGVTLVISPLIALMKDQIDFLVDRNVPAARLDSSLSREETIEVYDGLRSGRLKILYASPERLANERFLQTLGRLKIDLLAVDEAHCISEWGHNFRPDYLKLAALAKKLAVGRVLALTATATPQVATDIAQAFGIADDDVIQTGFYRPNLNLCVTPCTAKERPDVLLDRLRKKRKGGTGDPMTEGPTIVYVSLQRTAEEVANRLVQNGFAAVAYHAGMKPEKRTEIQNAFMRSDNMIVVATIAFGMGIDKANIRAVYHYNLPKSLESYVQEIGRSGRNGEPADCEMLACADDVVTLQNFSYGDTPTVEAVRDLAGELLGQGEQFDVSTHDLSYRHDVRELVVKTLLTYFELDGILQSTGPFYSQFKFKPLRRSVDILAQFDPQRADFLKAIFCAARPGKTWFTIDVAEVSHQIGHPRDRIVAALDYLEQKGEMIVQAAGLRKGYRIARRPDDVNALVDQLAVRFVQREEHDIARLERVLALAEQEGCLVQYLLDYFGESRDACGHCSRCGGEPARPLPPAEYSSPDATDLEAIRQLRGKGHAALRSPRQLARFLCGVGSPATSRAKLRGHPMFGKFDRVPFAEVLALIE